MRSAEFIRRMRRLGRKSRIPFRCYPRRVVGSHGKVNYGDRAATIIDLRHEIRPDILRTKCRQLGIDPKNIYGELATRMKRSDHGDPGIHLSRGAKPR